MDTSLPASREPRHHAFCPTCGRPADGPPRGECPGCTGLFDVRSGRGLYSPSTGKLWFVAKGNGALINPGYPIRRTGAVSSRVRCRSQLASWWLMLGIVAVILYGCLHTFY